METKSKLYDFSLKPKLISIYPTLGSYSEVIEKIIFLAYNRNSSYVCFANVHMIIEAYKDAAFAKVVNSASIIASDGMPLVIALKWLYGIKQDRLAGMDLMPLVLLEAEKKKISVFFYGSTPENLEAISTYIKYAYPNLSIAGVYSPPFRPLTNSEEFDIINKINNSGANLIFVSLGCPKQENWMYTMNGKINGVMLGVGNAFLTTAGLENRAPQWMRKASLEWLYRLIIEPRRLWKRYLFTNTLFLILLFKEVLLNKVSKYFKKR